MLPVAAQPWLHDWQCAALRATQVLPQQICVSPHLVPQAPQFAGSLVVSVQPLAQQVCEPVHGAPPLHWHTPMLQWLPLVHVGLQETTTQRLPWHSSLEAQAMPQLPQ